MNTESATLLQDQLAKDGGKQEELLAKMKAEYESLRDLAVANFEHDLSTLQNVYRNALTENERKDGGSFSSKHFEAVEKRLKMNPESELIFPSCGPNESVYQTVQLMNTSDTPAYYKI